MLSELQKKAFEEGFSQYKAYRLCEDKESDAAINRLLCAFQALAEPEDELNNEVDAIFYQVVYANIIDDMQRSGRFEMGDVLQKLKLRMYAQTYNWFLDMEKHIDAYKGLLWGVLDKLAEELIKGENMSKNDQAAWRCCQYNQKLGYPLAAMMLEDFVEGSDGTMIYTGPLL